MTKYSSLEKLSSFIKWVDEEKKKRGWTDYQLSKQSDLAASAISKARSGDKPLGWEACLKVANGFKLPPSLVFEKSGLLPPTSEMNEDEKELVFLFQQLHPDRQKEFIKMIRVLLPEDKK
jgi:transcriptional regulator with XRE-family HTH domain